MSCTSPFTVASTMRALASALSAFSMCGSRCADGRLHRLGRLQHLGDDHLVGAEQAADLVHAGHQRAVDDLAAAGASRSASSRSANKPVLRALEDVARQALVERQVAALLDRLSSAPWRGSGRLKAAIGSSPRHQIRSSARRRSSSGIDGVALELLGVDDRHVEAGLHAVVEEDRVQHLASGRRQAERDVGDAEDGLALRQRLLDQADALDRLDAGADVVLVAGADREDQRVEDRCPRPRRRTSSVSSSCERCAICQLALARDRLRLLLVLVDAADHQRGAVACAPAARRARSAPRRPRG